KGFFPVLLGNILIASEDRRYTFALVIIAPVMGHIFSIFHNWNGGLGIATTFGTMIAIFLQSRLLVLLVGNYAIGKFLLKFRHKHQRTLFVFGVFLVEILLLNSKDAYSLAYFCIACVILLKCLALDHKDPISTIINGHDC
ncbi:MAG: glycerol-3-phosphate acyltransferase, partial [Clostridiales bacterium]|nr:glycerol-3-phosphate acyltransferase [Clostridiales bacterium]